MAVARHILASELAEKIRAIEGRYTLGAPSSRTCIHSSGQSVISTGWLEIDHALRGGLPTGLHEWFSGAETKNHRVWSPPLCILVHLAWQAIQQTLASRWTVWVGQACHPYPRVLVKDKDRRLLEHSLFIAPRDVATRLWAIDLALRSPAVGAVIADSSGFDKAATQRLQLLSRSEEKWALAARPSREQDMLSAAQTRWTVRTAEQKKAVESKASTARLLTSSSVLPRWSVELLRCKGVRPTQDHPEWLLEWNRAEGAVNLSAPLADLAGAAGEPPRQQRTA
jgi:hypothetical protein